MRQPKSSRSFPPLPRTRGGFTMIEMLIALAILIALTALALPAILLARKRGIETRVRSDLALIGTALDEYAAQFQGSYPSFSTAAADYTNAQAYPTTDINYPWLDYKNYRGAVLLCRTLIGSGPGPALSTTIANPPTGVQGEDGADGTGFRARRTLNFINGSWVVTGKVYGPYVDASKFRLMTYPDYEKSKNPGYTGAADPNGAQMMLDTSGNPILYYPALTGNPTPNLYYADPTTYNPTTGYVTATYPFPRFNGYDNQAFVDSTLGSSTFNTASPFAVLASGCGSLPYLLWTAGVDGQFGFLANQTKTDDIANFALPYAK